MMESIKGKVWQPNVEASNLHFRPGELGPGGFVEKPEELMTDSQRAAQDKLKGLFSGIDAQFSQRGELEQSGSAIVLRDLPKGIEVARDKITGDPLKDSHGNLIVKVGNQHFAVTSRNLQAKPDGTIRYTPLNFAADPKGAQAAAKASHDNSNAPHPVATVFQAKPKPETAAQKLAQEQALIQQREQQLAREAAAAKAAQQAKITAKSKTVVQSKQTRSNPSQKSGNTATKEVEFQTSTVAAMAAANMSKTHLSTQQMKAEADRAEAESQQTGSIFAAVTAKQGSAQSNDQQQGHKEQGQQNAEAQKTSDQIRKETTETVTGKTAAGGTPGRSKK